MSSTLTPVLGLYKPVPGTAEPFRSSDINGNWNILDTAFTAAVLGPNIQVSLNTGLTINGGTA